ncbi:MBL fold metallo-hydrolase [Sphingomicrobium lutaoense]|uniref:beta-lactamase n=1 Tax=Sphingomicrobium lutaoense TaxID=515949 RepID=A0A839Z066_9SPHN|nr:MBL fold metallo-hydrolase [Sphingomicrobium lutaoense]MBB3764080.1 glyoxylase-like metal-dependent hydrolase (beta-lactamase superfamily II) [Sphingomicrobium lutaoense]
MRHIAPALAALAMLSAPAGAQDRFADRVIEVREVAPGVAVMFGQGGNIGVSHGEDGVVLIDDQFAGLTDKILAAVDDLGHGPVRFVLNTHYHGDHTGGNENLGKAGAIIMAHHNVRARLAEALEEGEGTGGLPVLTFASGVNLHWNGEEIHIFHVHHAHTDGDSIVGFRNANVVHMGDTFFNKVTWPYIDLTAGGSIDGLIATAKRVLDHSDAETVIIPGHGPLADRADLAAYHDMLVALRDRVQQGVDNGETLDELQARNLTAGYEVGEGFITGPKFIEAVYKSLTGSTDYKPR